MNLLTLQDGAVMERLSDALQEAMANIDDPNTDDRTRKISLVVKLKPDKNDRSSVMASVEVDTKLAPPTAIPARVFIGRQKDGRYVAEEHNPKQLRMFDENSGPVGVVEGEATDEHDQQQAEAAGEEA